MILYEYIPYNKKIDMIKDFEELIKNLGYNKKLSIHEEIEKQKKRIIYQSNTGSMAIDTFILLYPNKESYIYLEFLDHPNNVEKIKSLAKRLFFEEDTRIAEVGWEVIYSKQPNEFDLQERTKIFYAFLKDTFKHLQDGMIGINPNPGDVLAAKPYGPKLNEGFTESSIQIGTRQRSIITRRFGFGELYDDGFQYARYDKNLNLRPI